MNQFRSEPFYKCEVCSRFFQGKKFFKGHIASCSIGSSAAKIRKVNSSCGSASSEASSCGNSPCTFIPRRRSAKSPSNDLSATEEESETEECSSHGDSFESSRIMESEEEQDLPLKITSVTGYGGVSTPIVVKKEDVWRREKATIPVLMEKIKVEPVERITIPVDQKIQTKNKDGRRVAIETTRRLQIKLEPITDSIRQYVFEFKSPVKKDNCDKPDKPVIRPLTSRELIDPDTAIKKLPSTLSTSATAVRDKTEDNLDQRKASRKRPASEDGQRIEIYLEVEAWPIFNNKDKNMEEKTGKDDMQEKTGKDTEEEKTGKDNEEEKTGKDTEEEKTGKDNEEEKTGKDDEEETSPACSYINAFNPNCLSKRKRRISASTEIVAPMNLPSHVTLLTDEQSAKPVYKCNFCQKHLYNETQFSPHKQCQAELAPKPKGRKKRYCICRNYWVGDWKIPMIQCTYCRKWMHGKCMGLSDEFLNNYPPEKAWECCTCKQKRMMDEIFGK